MKQSRRAYLPKINPAIRFADFVKRESLEKRFIAHCADGEKRHLGQTLQPGEPAVILIGPEGDFSAAEIDPAVREGFIPTTFGRARLRTDTAALVACVEAYLFLVNYSCDY